MTELPIMIYDGEADLDQEVIHDAITGERLTTTLIERENDSIDRKHGLIPGGKSLSGGSTHSPRFQLILGEKTAEKVKEVARQEGMSVSRWLRRTVEEKLAA